MSGLLMKKCCCVPPCGLCNGTTPKTWLVSFTGTDTNAPCSFCGLSPNRNFQGMGDALGTYTVTQSADPSLPCRFSITTTGGPRLVSHTRTGGGDTSCTATTTIDDLYVELNSSTTTFTLQAGWNPSDLEHSLWFSAGAASDHDCCSAVSFANGLTFYNCQQYGINGSAVATPDCP